jgi:hypothetical protein
MGSENFGNENINNNNSSIESYLRENYRTVEELDNGWYCRNGGGDYNAVYVPKNCDGNMAMVSYFPGSGGSNPDANAWVDLIHSDNPPEYIVTISSESTDTKNMMIRTYDELTNRGVNITDVVDMVFSAGGGTGYKRTDEFLASHPDVNVTLINTNVLRCDDNALNHLDRFPHILESGAQIIYVDSPKDQSTASAIKSLTEGGFNAYLLESSSSSHILFNKDIINSRFTDFILGYSDSFGIEGTNYNLVVYDSDTKKTVAADLNDLWSDYLARTETPGLPKADESDSFLITKQNIFTDTMGILSGLKNLALSIKDGVVSSDYTYIENVVNSNRNIVKNTKYLTNLKIEQYRSNSGIPGIIPKYINDFFNIVSDLLEKLAIESESIFSYAEAMVAMDEDIKAGVSEIGTVSEIEYGFDHKLKTTYVKKEGPYENKMTRIPGTTVEPLSVGVYTETTALNSGDKVETIGLLPAEAVDRKPSAKYYTTTVSPNEINEQTDIGDALKIDYSEKKDIEE